MILFSCGPAAHRDPVIGEAFVGPANVSLRKEIAPKSGTVETVHFGDKVAIIATKRRFVKVRTRSGAEGWLEDYMLLGQSDMDQIKNQSAAARAYPSQGIATSYETMNVHAQPNRFSPSYLQVKEGEKFDVLQHRVVAVPASAIRKPLISSSKRAKKTKKENKARIPSPPAPPAPALPPDWIDLSKQGDDAVQHKVDEPPPVTPEEDWSLIRTASGQSGWVLTRRLFMAIPDEVAQYAEGRRITSYFSLGKIEDGDRAKNVWLWTTISSSNQPFDYDSIRVFIWNPRRHRYETALILRHLQGYFPTEVDSSAGTFGICIERENGQRYRREYQLVQNIVRFTGEKSCDQASAGNRAHQNSQSSNSPESSSGTFQKFKGKLKNIVGK